MTPATGHQLLVLCMHIVLWRTKCVSKYTCQTVNVYNEINCFALPEKRGENLYRSTYMICDFTLLVSRRKPWASAELGGHDTSM